VVTHLEHSRSYPVALDDAFERTLTVPLEQVLGRRYLAVAGVAGTEQRSTWGADGIGQERTIRFTDGATARETLTELARPHHFSYRLDAFTGLLKPLLGHVEGRWSFAPAGTGTRVTWSWDVTPASSAASLAMPALRTLWAGVARQGFDDLESHLVT
jgi:hypothetical protein